MSSDENEKSERNIRRKPAIGGLIGGIGGSVRLIGCKFKGKITVHGKPEGADVGPLIGRVEENANVEVEDSSAEAEIEYKQD